MKIQMGEIGARTRKSAINKLKKEGLSVIKIKKINTKPLFRGMNLYEFRYKKSK